MATISMELAQISTILDRKCFPRKPVPQRPMSAILRQKFWRAYEVSEIDGMPRELQAGYKSQMGGSVGSVPNMSKMQAGDSRFGWHFLQSLTITGSSDGDR